MALAPPETKLTFEEFLDWLDEDTRAEWSDGEVLVTSPASQAHQDISRFLIALISHVVEHDDAGVVLSAPFVVRLPPPLQRAREPDVFFVAREHLDRLRPTYLDGPPDLVVEIVSPESFARDRGEKYVEYEQAGVREYWLIDRDRRQAEFYRLGADGRYRLALGGADGEYRSAVLPRLRVEVEWLWRDRLPKLVDVLRTLELL
jgi:Uma2 family endonuclease